MCLRNRTIMIMVVIKADGGMLLGRVEALIYSSSITESQASLLQATQAPDTNHGGKMEFQKDTR